MNSYRTLRIARFLIREAVHYDPVTRQPLRYHERDQTLLKYQERDDVFGSFTAVLPQGRKDKGQGAYSFTPKLGINPSSSYNTPTGIYAYPVEYLLDKYNPVTGEFTVPFAGDQPYLCIFQVRDLDQGFLVFDSSDTQVLDKYRHPVSWVQYQTERAFIDIGPVLQEINEVLKDERADPFMVPEKYRQFKYWTLMDEETKVNFQDWYDTVWYPRFLRKTGLDKVNDPGLIQTVISHGMLAVSHILHTLKVGFDFYNIQRGVYDYLKNRTLVTETGLFPGEKQIKKLLPVQRLTESEYLKLRQGVLSERVACDWAFIWNMTRHLSNKNPRVWTGLLRKLGFRGAVDHGTGTIHPSEKTQMIIFDPGSVKVLEVIHNELPHTGDEARLERSQWSRNLEQGISRAVREVTIFINNALSGSLYFSDCTRIISVIGWLNQHARDSVEWTKKIREDYVAVLEKAIQKYFSMSDELKGYLNRIIGLLHKFGRKDS